MGKISEKDLAKEARDLRKRIAELSEENELLTEKAEDIFLLGVISEKINLETDDADVIANAMESICALKDVAYCSFLSPGGGILEVRDEYAVNASGLMKGKKINFDDELSSRLLKEDYFIDLSEVAELPPYVPFLRDKFRPNACYMLPLNVRERLHGIIMCVNAKGDSNYLRGIVPLLDRIRDLIEKRLETISYISELREINKTLELRVQERTSALQCSYSQLKREIKSRESAEKTIKDSERRYQSIFKEALDGIVLIDGESGQIIDCNPAFESINGRGLDELKSMKIWEIRPQRYFRAARREFFEIMNKGSGSSGEFEILRSDGSLLPVEFVSTCVVIGNKVYLQSICRDVSEIRKYRDDLYRKMRNLRIINDLIRNVTSSIDLETVLHKVACNATELLGGDGASVALYDEKTDTVRYPYHYKMPDSLREVVADRGRGLAGEIMRTGRSVILNDYPAHPKALQEFIDAGLKVLIAVPLVSKEDAFGALGVFGMTADKTFSQEDLELLESVGKEAAIAIQNARLFDEVRQFSDRMEEKVKIRTRELEQAHNDLKKANEKLKELDRLKSMFIASMSHELRTPLNSIMGFTDLILQGMAGEISDEQRDYLKRVYSSARHLLDLIIDVIDISKIEAGKMGTVIKKFMLEDVIDEAVSSISRDIDRSGLELRTRIEKGIMIESDRRRLLQCILNYLSNAVKFTKSGTITLTANHFNGMVEISVKDTGIGIRDEDLPRLFNSFVRLESPLKNQTEGTGLGLYLTRKIAREILHGEVACMSRYGQGSVFQIRIPVKMGG